MKTLLSPLLICLSFCLFGFENGPKPLPTDTATASVISIYNTPFRNRVRIEVSSELKANSRLELFHTNGELIREIAPSSDNHFVIEKGQLAIGRYDFRIQHKNELIGTGMVFFMD